MNAITPMFKAEYEVGETIKDTEAFGTVEVKDIFVSTTNPQFFCYRVEDTDHNSHLCSEENLIQQESGL